MGVKNIKIKSPNPDQQKLYAKIQNLIDDTGGLPSDSSEEDSQEAAPQGNSTPNTQGLLGL
jgi:hypothetical protein